VQVGSERRAVVAAQATPEEKQRFGHAWSRYDDTRSRAAHQARDPGRDPKPGQLARRCFASWMLTVLGLQARRILFAPRMADLRSAGNAAKSTIPPSSAASTAGRSLSLLGDAPHSPVGPALVCAELEHARGPVLARFGLTLPPKRKSAATRHCSRNGTSAIVWDVASGTRISERCHEQSV